jgi:hypothetical protein
VFPAEAASPGAEQHRARQGYAAGVVWGMCRTGIIKEGPSIITHMKNKWIQHLHVMLLSIKMDYIFKN